MGRIRLKKETTGIKRERGQNFTADVLENFLGIVLRHRNIVLNKSTDAATNKQKVDAGYSICMENNVQNCVSLFVVNTAEFEQNEREMSNDFFLLQTTFGGRCLYVLPLFFGKRIYIKHIQDQIQHYYMHTNTYRELNVQSKNYVYRNAYDVGNDGDINPN